MKLVIEQGVPSISAAVSINGKTIWTKSYNGVAGLKTVYGIGSISKSFTATAIFQHKPRVIILPKTLNGLDYIRAIK